MDPEYIIEPARSSRVMLNTDVAVIGGGIAGISAALASSRSGAGTVLIEKSNILGGLATSGLVCIYLPLCDGMGRQVSFGIVEELIKLSVSCGNEQPLPECWMTGGSIPDGAGARYQVMFNPSAFAILAEQLLRKAGVKILYGAQVCDVIMQDDRISSIIIEGVEGRRAIGVKSVVDASGDAVVCRFAKERTVEFGQKNILASWYCSVEEGKGNCIHPLGVCDIPDSEKDPNETDNRTRYAIGTTELVSRFLCDSHDAILKDFLAGGPVSAKHSLGTLPTIPQFRMTWRVDGNFVLDENGREREYADSIGIISNWKVRGPVYEIPYRALHGENISNILCAGRCISVTDTMWDITRVIPACAVTGQAAGTAAALGGDLRDPDINAVQDKLTHDGVILHIRDL